MRKKRRRSAVAPMSLFAFQDIVTSVTGVILLVAMAMAIQVGSAPARDKSEATAEEYEQLSASLAATEAESERLVEETKSSESLLADAATFAPGATAEERVSLTQEIERIESELSKLKEELAVEERLRDQTLAELAASEVAAETEAARSEIARLEGAIESLLSNNQMLFNIPERMSGRVRLVELFPDRILIARAGVAEKPLVFAGARAVSQTTDEIRSSPESDRWVLFAHPGTTKALSAIRQELDSRNRAVGFDLLPDSVTVIDPISGAP